MPRFNVTFLAPVRAYKTIVVDAPDEDSAYNIAHELLDEPYYQDATKWELEFDDSAQVDDIEMVDLLNNPL